MSLRLSIVTPSYNQGPFIEDAVASVLGQDYKCIEYLVIDAESNDETAQIVSRYVSDLTWVREPDRGQADAVNKGFRLSRGEVLGWLNADDVYCPGSFAEVAQRFQDDPDLMLLYGDAEHVDGEGRFLEKYPTRAFHLESFASHCFICQPACFFRKSLIEAVGFLDIDLQYALDLDLWIRCGLLQREHPSWKFEYLPRVLARSRMHQDNKTLSKRRDSLLEIIRVVDKHFGCVPFNWVYRLQEASSGPYDGYFRRSPFSISLWAKSVLHWLWMNRANPYYVLSYARDRLLSPRRSLRSFLGQQGGRA
ncbi:MAG: glycosyltransferase family 2 protein [Acidobacteriota bacterium]